jgi:DegV family protein with EDD domain
MTNKPPVIVTDAACDIPPVEFERYGIRVAPLKILFGDESYRSGVDMTHEQFYARLARGDVHPTTSQPTVPDFVELYTELSKNGTPVISIHLSLGLSGTANVARQAASQLPDRSITVRDAGTLSSALGIQVLTAARAAQAGYSVDRIMPLLELTHKSCDLLFTVEDLSYLYKGGRIGAVRYQLGQVLNIKPIITVCKTGDKAGTYISAGRARSLPKANEEFIKQITAAVGAGNKLRAVSLYGNDPTLAEELNRQLAERFDCVYLHAVPTAPVLGVHVGPGALGVGYAPGDWPV